MIYYFGSSNNSCEDPPPIKSDEEQKKYWVKPIVICWKKIYLSYKSFMKLCSVSFHNKTWRNLYDQTNLYKTIEYLCFLLNYYIGCYNCLTNKKKEKHKIKFVKAFY